MSYLSRRKVLARARENGGKDFPFSENMLRHRWSTHGDFLADFVPHALADRQWTLQIRLSRNARALLAEDVGFPGAVHRVACENLKLVLELPVFSFLLLAVATAQADSSSALARMHKNLSVMWIPLHSHVFEHCGFALRPGVSFEDFSIMLQAMAEGLGLRLLSGADEPLIAHKQHTSLLGTAALPFFMAVVDPGDGLTLEGAADKALEQLRQR